MGDYHLYGAVGSPYTQKMKSYLRYKRVRHQFRIMSIDAEENWKRKFPGIPKVIPVLVSPDGSYKNDSTFLIQSMEQKVTDRSVYPDDAAMKFIALLVEDFADEWMTKVMYGARWLDPEDAKFAGGYVCSQSWYGSRVKSIHVGNTGKTMTIDLPTACNFIEKTQVRRIKKVGCADWALLAETTRQVCGIITANQKNNGKWFLFGDRPSVADFALYGQMSQFMVDNSVNKILRDFPYAYAWVHSLTDLSGVDPGKWDAEPSKALKNMLQLIGAIYVPFLKANANAYERKDKDFTVAFMGGKYFHTQAPYGYQAKCLKELQRQYDSLSPIAQKRVSTILKKNGVENIFTARARL